MKSINEFDATLAFDTQESVRKLTLVAQRATGLVRLLGKALEDDSWGKGQAPMWLKRLLMPPTTFSAPNPEKIKLIESFTETFNMSHIFWSTINALVGAAFDEMDQVVHNAFEGNTTLRELTTKMTTKNTRYPSLHLWFHHSGMIAAHYARFSEHIPVLVDPLEDYSNEGYQEIILNLFAPGDYGITTYSHTMLKSIEDLGFKFTKFMDKAPTQTEDSNPQVVTYHSLQGIVGKFNVWSSFDHALSYANKQNELKYNVKFQYPNQWFRKEKDGTWSETEEPAACFVVSKDIGEAQCE